MSGGEQNFQDNLTGGGNRLYLLLLVFALVTAFFLYTRSPINPVCLIFPEKPHILRVAHAGGGIDGVMYTNSIQAMNVNYAKGFRYFEIDFNLTSDSNIVCVHDWARFRRLGNKDNLDIPLSFSEFEAINKSIYKYEKCTLRTLAEWFDAHPDAFLVTDVKDNNIDALREILNQIPNSRTVVIPQIYRPDEYNWVLAAGVEKVIWTLYRSELTELQVLKNLSKMDRVIAITMPLGKAESSFPVKVLMKGLAVYVHTINDNEEYTRLKQQYCVSEIYTDFLDPET
jgi:glycerophosphoryl diester phosphodiesterase